MKIAIIEPIGAKKEEIKKFESRLIRLGHELVVYKEKPKDERELVNRSRNADILVLSTMKLDSDMLNECRNIKMISVAFTGVDNIDILTCKKRKIVVCNAPGYSTYAVSELTMALMISVLRNIPNMNKMTKEGRAREGFLGSEIRGKTIGIIGTGEIGLRVAELGKAFGAKILAYSRTRKKIPRIKYIELNELIKKSDIISLHLPLSDSTRHIISKEKISLMKSTSIIINTARGGLIDNDALTDALNKGKIAGAGIDVFDYEPPLFKPYKLMVARNTVLTPHIGFATKEAIDARTDIVFDNILRFLKNKTQNQVN